MKIRLVAAIALALLPAYAGAGDTDLDPTFGTAGQVRLSATTLVPSSVPTDLALMPDSRVVTAMLSPDLASLTVTRVLADGSPDPTFGTGGSASIPVSGDYTEMYRLLLAADGGVIVLGRFTPGLDEALARFDATGTPDGTFGVGGVLVIPTIDGGSTDENALIAANGDIVTIGVTHFGTDTTLLVRRFFDDGTPDPGFGTGGVVKLDPTTFDDKGLAVVEQPDGRLLIAAGRTTIRLLADGSPDPSFGTGGIVPSATYALHLLSDGDYLALVSGPFGIDLTLERRNPDGTLDPDFGTGGTVVIEHLSYARPYYIAVDTADRITVAGMQLAQERPAMVLARFEADGTLDTSIAPCGYGVVGVPLARARFAQQGDGRLLIAGVDLYTTATPQVGLARLGTADPELPCLGTSPDKGSAYRMRALRGGSSAQWSWRSGGAVTTDDIGDPFTGSAYGLCIVDTSPAIPQLLLATGLPPQALCAGKPCWTRSANGQLRYSLRDNRTQLTFKPGAAAKKAKLTWKTNQSGPLSLPPRDFPPVTIPVPLTVRLDRNDGPQCWEAVHSREVKNGGPTILLTSD